MIPSRNFNLILPYEMYRKLKSISAETEKPVAEIVRRGIDLVLKNHSSKGFEETECEKS